MYSLWQDLSVHTKNFDLVTLTLTFDILLKKLNLGLNFWTKSDLALKLHIYSLWQDLSNDTNIFDVVAYLWINLNWLLGGGGGISPVRTDPDPDLVSSHIYALFEQGLAYCFVHDSRLVCMYALEASNLVGR